MLFFNILQLHRIVLRVAVFVPIETLILFLSSGSICPFNTVLPPQFNDILDVDFITPHMLVLLRLFLLAFEDD